MCGLAVLGFMACYVCFCIFGVDCKFCGCGHVFF